MPILPQYYVTAARNIIHYDVKGTESGFGFGVGRGVKVGICQPIGRRIR